MDSNSGNENMILKNSLQSYSIDIVNLELCQRQIEAELKTRRVQVDQLREQVDSQTIKIHELQKNVYEGKSKITNLEYELEMARKNCSAVLLQNKSSIQSKFQQEKIIAENLVLKDQLQKREIENQKLLRQIDDISTEKQVEVANRKDLMERDFKTRRLIEKFESSLKQVEKEAHKINLLYDNLQKIKNANDQINMYKEIANNAVLSQNKMEEQYLHTKAKLDMITEMIEKHPLPKSDIDGSKQYKEEILRLQEELEEEKDLTIKQNRRLADEITLNVSLCFKMDHLEQQLENFKHRSKYVNDVSVQTEEIKLE